MHEGRLLAVLHERLGTEVWEVPGGHLEEGETFEEAAARETFEETGISVHVEDLLAACVHEWVARRQRRLILFFKARPLEFSQPRPGDAGIVRAEWVDQSQMTTELTSAFLHPLLELGSGSTPSRVAPVMFRAEHRRDESGCWRPYIVPNAHV